MPVYNIHHMVHKVTHGEYYNVYEFTTEEKSKDFSKVRMNLKR